MSTLVPSAILVAVIVALVELAKKLDFPARFLPLLSVFFGLSGGLLLWYFSSHPEAQPLLSALLLGLLSGLSACGLYDVTKRSLLDRWPLLLFLLLLFWSGLPPLFWWQAGLLLLPPSPPPPLAYPYRSPSRFFL